MLNKHNFSIAKLAPKEWIGRYTLGGIRVTPDGTAVTDGHLAVTVSGTPTTAQEFPFVNGAVPVDDFLPFTMRKDDAIEVAKQAPKKQTIPVLDHIGIGAETVHNGHVQVLTTDLGNPQTRSFNKVDTAFPDVARVTPDPEGCESTAFFNADLLIGVLQQVQKFHGKARMKGVRIRLYGPENSVRFDATNEAGQKLMGLVMPARE